jgi:hypothetical protein
MESVFSHISQTCPVGRRNDSCPFHQFDAMTMEQVVKYVQNMDGTERRKFIKHHKECVAVRKKEKVKKKTTWWISRMFTY